MLRLQREEIADLMLKRLLLLAHLTELLHRFVHLGREKLLELLDMHCNHPSVSPRLGVRKLTSHVDRSSLLHSLHEANALAPDLACQVCPDPRSASS